MSKILITADIHLGYANKLKDGVWALDVMAQYAKKHGIEDFVILGDLFHDRVSLGIEVISAAFKFFRRHPDMNFVTYCGNHDMFMKNSWEINSLEPLTELITVVDGISKIEIKNKTFHILPFIHYESVFMEELAKIEKNMGADDVLLTHIGIHNASLNECFLLKHWSIVDFTKSKFNRIFTGHFHCHQQVGENVWYPGSPIPFRFDEGVVDHGFLLYDVETREVEFIKIYDICKDFSDYKAPDYLTLIDEDLEEWMDAIPGNNVRISLSKDHTANQLADIRTKLKDKGAISTSFVQPKKEMTEASAIQNQIVGLSTMEETFETWLKYDEPKNLNVSLLKQLCSTLLAEAEERIVTEEPSEDGA